MMFNQNNNNQMDNNIMLNNQVIGNKNINAQINNQALTLNNNIDQPILDNHRKNLINSIIKFYKDNGLKNMDFSQMSQIKLLNKHLGPNFIGFKFINEENRFNYIKGNKKLVYFVNSGYNIIKVKIPYLITKSELYSIANLFKYLCRTNILLIHSEKILERDESSIEEFSEGDFIIIIEDRYYPDDEYFISLKEKNIRNNDRKLNIVLRDETKAFVPEIKEGVSIFELGKNGKFWTRFLILSPNMLLSELIESIQLIFGSNSKDLRIIGPNGYFIKSDENKGNKKIGEIFSGGELLSIYNSGIPEIDCEPLGKKLLAKAGNNMQIKVGRLNSTKVLFCINHGFRYFKKDLKEVIINNRIIKIDEDNSFYSLGLNNNFECILK